MTRFLLLFLVLTTSSAVANPFFIGRYDGLDAGPTDRSAFAIYWNPAGIAQDGGSLHTHLLLVNRFASYDRVAELNDVAPEWAHINAGENTTGGTSMVPAMAFRYGMAVGDFNLGFGFAGFVERAGVAFWKRNLGAPSEYPGAIDGPQRWLSLNAGLLIYSPAASIGLAHTPSGVSFGVTPTLNFATLSTITARNPDGSDRVIDDAGRLAEGRLFVEDASDEQIGLTVGFQYTGIEDVVFGLSWQKEVIYTLQGPAKLSFGAAEETTVDAAIDLPVAQAIRWGVDLTFSRWVFRPMISWIQWSVMEQQKAINRANGESLMDLPRNWSDAWSGRLRVDYLVSDSIRLTLGGAYELGVTPLPSFEPGMSESDNWEAAIGGSFQLSESVRLSTSYTWQQYADVTVTNSIKRPLANGHYTDRRQYLTLDLEVTL